MRIQSNPTACGAFFAALVLFSVTTAHAADYIWWEGEDAIANNFPKNNPFGARTLGENAKLLSGGEWLNASGKGTGQAVTAKWNIAVPSEGDYSFWVRKFWKHGPFKWRFDSMPAGEWRECGANVALADDTPLKKFVNANWVSLGSIKLPKGPHTFDIELITEPGKDWGAAIDCFVLAQGPFVPNGNARPGAKIGKADDGYFPFEPDADLFKPDALLDLRSLNEPVAGQGGFLKHAGSQITLGNGTPAKFWAVNVGAGNAEQDHASVDYLARKLAKLGVNMVRFHSPLWSDANPARLDPKKLDALFYLITAMKKQGIYTKLSFYFPVWADAQKLGLEGYEGQQNKRPFGLLYFDPKLQELHRGWAREMLTTKNPYTGTTLAAEPAVGIVEIINEDSLFFWTFTKKNIPPTQWSRLETLYGQWLTRKYGAIASAYGAWSSERAAGDTGNQPALYEIFHMTSSGVKQGGAGKAKRVGDQIQFLAELQRGFYETTVNYLKKDLHVGGLISCSNWTTADPMLLGAVERWTYTAGDIIDSHGYFGGEHKGDGADYSVRVGHTFKDAAAVLSPGALPLRFQQVEGFPQIISEIGFPQPNRYRADGVFLSSAYASLQGVDGVFLFAVASNYLRDASIQKFQVASPAIIQSFPAAALVYRLGYVKEAEPAVYQVTPPADLWALRGVGGWSADALDEFRKKDLPPGVTAIPGQVDKVDGFTPYVGPVVRSFGSDATKSWQRDLPKFIDRSTKRVNSLTGELRWDYGEGVTVMNSPRAEGAAGFLAKAHTIKTENASITLQNEFGTVTLVPLDGQPLVSSKKILLQVMTQEQLTGFREENGTLKDLGSAPFGIRKIAGTVELNFVAGGPPARISALDANGYAMMNQPVKSEAGTATGSVRIELLPDVLYYVVSR